jgi:hypothetical protein
MNSQEAEKAFQRDQVQNQIEEIHPSRIVDVENDNPGTVKDVTSRSSRRNVVDLCGSPPSTNRKRPAVSQLHRQSSPNVTQDNSGNRPTIARRPAIKQEPIDVDALSDTDVRMLSAPTIKYDASHASTRTAKRVKFEEVQEDDRVDLSRIEEFQQREPKTVEWEDRMAEKQSGDPKEVAEEEMGIVELDPVAEDSMSVEERHAAAQEKAKNDEEIEEASRQWAAMMKKAAQAEQSAM